MPAPALRRQLGLSAVAAIVVGDMLGSGIFFTPGELAAVEPSPRTSCSSATAARTA